MIILVFLIAIIYTFLNQDCDKLNILYNIIMDRLYRNILTTD